MMRTESAGKIANEIWPDGAQWILYTTNTKLISEIRGWDAFKDERIREMGTYHKSVEHAMNGLYYAMQFRFRPSLRKRVCRAARITYVPTRTLNPEQMAAVKSTIAAQNRKRSLARKNKPKPRPGGVVARHAVPRGDDHHQDAGWPKQSTIWRKQE